MVNEATLSVKTGLPINFTVADGTGIEKGAILKLTDPMTASTASGDEDIVAGIAAVEKIASDGVTKLAVYREGIFEVIASGSITAGDSVAVDGTDSKNYVKAADATCVGSKILGIALETASDEERILVEVKIGANNNAYA